ncbi:hypothetical protein [Campylobacter sp. CCUG 57310]|uniref:hypothetical protein n=1 Tax=Campylobacter sp. CCUG 57310 TaxID=2517362 RepID=UPI0020B14238|nr:hypothetical protein [Campylobacter sp. CCUG 57310]
MVKFLKLFVLAILLSSCNAKFQPPILPKFSEKNFEVISRQGTGILYVASTDKGYNFTLISVLGAPLARRILTKDGKFENIGFLPPNLRYNDLFAAVLDMIKNKEHEKEILIDEEKFKVKSIDIR